MPAGEAHADDALIGEILAQRYQLELRLGEGAMGTVYRARHVKVGRAFAVKVLHDRLLADAKVAQRFEREAELAGRLRHPNVIGVVDVGETPDGRRYMVMDFAAGPDLATVLAEAPLPAPRIVHLTRQLLEGLHHAHEAGLIHRDLKPENVIVERDADGRETPRIVDFGIAILREGGASTDAEGRLTTNGLVLGTPHYMAPEQAIADPIDHRIDLFALGIVVYEMLSGRMPFDGSGADVARANLLLDPPPIARRVPYLEVDPLLEAFARRLMAKRRDQRPATARAARELLDLIERDRAAAAELLRPELGAGEVPRTPAVTQDATPIPGTIPALSQAASAPLVAADGVDERARATDDVRPVRGRRGWIAALALVLLGGGVTVAVLATRGAHEPPPIDAAVAIVLPPPDAAPPPIDAASADAPIAIAIAPTPDAAPPARPHPRTPPHDPPPHDPPPHDPPPPPEVSVAQLVALYAAVGKELEAVRDRRGDDAIADTQPRYRRINLNAAMTTPESRREAFAALTTLQRALRAK